MLRQGSRTLSEHCEAGRDILRWLGEQKEWDREVEDMLIGGLNDVIWKRVVGGTLGKSEYDFEKVVETISGSRTRRRRIL